MFIYMPPLAKMRRVKRKGHETLEYVGRQFLSELGLGQWRGREFWGMRFNLQWLTYLFIYRPPLAEMGRVKRKGHKKLEYVGPHILSELGLGQWRGREFWGMVFILQWLMYLFIYRPPLAEMGRVKRKGHKKLEYVGRQFLSELGLGQGCGQKLWGMMLILQWLTYLFICRPPLALMGRVKRKGHEKLEYVGRQLLSELGLRQWHGPEVWGMMFILQWLTYLFIYRPPLAEMGQVRRKGHENLEYNVGWQFLLELGLGQWRGREFWGMMFILQWLTCLFIYRPPLAEMGRVKRKGHEKLEYVGRQFLSELGLRQGRGREFWGMMLILQWLTYMFIYRPPLAEMGRVKRKGHEKLEYVGRQFLSELGLRKGPGWKFWGMLFILQRFMYLFIFRPPLAEMGRVKRKGHEKLEYVGRQFLSELGLGQWRGREFWGMLFILVIVFFIRMYLHYIGQWLLLSAFEIPINM